MAVVAAIAAGCGGSGESSENTSAPPSSTPTSSQGASNADAWAASFCGYAKTWQTSLQQAAADLKTSHTRASASAALTTAKSSTILFSQQLSRLGPPAGTPQQVTQQLRQYGNRLRSSNQYLQSVLGTSSGSASQQAAKIQTARATLTVMVSQLRQAYAYIAKLNVSPQLKQALTGNSTCQAVFGKG